MSQWYQDYPAASDFLYVLFGCNSFHPGSDSSVNIAGFCDKEIEAKMEQALKIAVTDPEGANEMWAEIDKQVMEQAPMAALFTPKHVDFVSKRLGNFQFNAQFYWVIAAVLGEVGRDAEARAPADDRRGRDGIAW